MKKTLMRLLALALVLCSILSYAAPTANADWWDDLWNDITGGGSSGGGNTAQTVTYNFDLYSQYKGVPVITDAKGKEYNGVVYQTLIGDLGTSTYDYIPNRFNNGDINWTYETASSSVRGSTGDLEHMPNLDSRFTSAYGFRSVVKEGAWLALRIKSPGAGTYGMKLNYTAFTGSGTIAFYILPAEGSASVEKETVLSRAATIEATLHPSYRVGTAKLSNGTNAVDNSAVIGGYEFEEGKEYILVMKNQEASAESSSAYLAIKTLEMVPGELEDDSQTTQDIKAVTAQKNAVPASDNGGMAAVWEVDGHDYYFLPLEGGKMMIFDLETWQPVKSVDTGLHHPTSADVTPDGKMIIAGGSRKMFIFDINTMRGSLTPDMRTAEGFANENTVHRVFAGDDGYVYIATGIGGMIGRYDIAGKKFEAFCDIIDPALRKTYGITTDANDKGDTEGEVNGVTVCGNYIYAIASSGNYKVIAKYDIANKQLVGMIDVTKLLKGGSTLRLSVLGGKYLMAGASGDEISMALINLDKWSLVKENDSDYKKLFTSSSAKEAWSNGADGLATKEINGKQFFFGNNKSGMFYYDIANEKIVRLRSGSSASVNVMGKPTVTVDLSGGDNPTEYIMTFASGGEPRFFKPSVGSKVARSEKLMKQEYGTGGSPIKLNAQNGTQLFIGAWNNYACAVYDTALEKVSQRYYTAGQTDSQLYYKGQLYAGNYSASVVTKVNMDVEEQTEFVIENLKPYKQQRIHTLAAGNDHIFCGTIPNYTTWGGAVTAYDMNKDEQRMLSFRCQAVSDEKAIGCTGATTGVHHPLCNLAVNGVVYEGTNDVVLGATTRNGGTSVKFYEGTSAQIFVLDYYNMEILATLDLRETDLGLKSDVIDYIGGLTIDPNVPGRVWGLVSEVLFYFTYNKETNEFEVTKVLDLGSTEYTTSGNISMFNRQLLFDTEYNQMYMCFPKSGMKRITVNDLTAATVKVVSTESILVEKPEFYTLSTDITGKAMLYYSVGNDLKAYPIHVDEDDWAAAKVVDDMIDDIGTVTADKADDIAAARAAYDALPLRHKALIQNQLTLTEAEALVLEMQIDEIIETPLINDLGKMGEFVLTYNNLTEDQKTIVRNFETLSSTYDAVLAIAQNTNAGAVQEAINALAEVTSANAANVVAVREAYNALTDEQKAYVDTEKLVAAEAQLAEMAQSVQAQIDALPENIVITDISVVKTARAAYEALFDFQKAQIDTAKLVAAEEALANIALNAVPTQQVYNFEIYEDPIFYTDCTKYTYDASLGRIAEIITAAKGYNSTYATIEKWFYGSYPATVNWGIEPAGNSLDDYIFRGKDDQGMRLGNTTTAGTYSAIRIFVPAAGLYEIALQAGDYKSTFGVYVIPASTLYADARASADAISAAMTAENCLLSKTVLRAEAEMTAGQWNFPEAGDYIVIFKAEDANSKGVNFRKMTLTPVIDAETAVAVVGEDNYFLTLKDAFDYQAESGAECVSLNKDSKVSDLVIPAGAVLDLNGKKLTVDSVLSYASSGIIDSSENASGVLVILDADGNMLSENNAQLPIFDAAAGGYRFFAVEVKSVAVTGKENPKYWFTVEFANFDAVYELISAGSAVDFKVLLTVNGEEAQAVANPEFVKQWAEAYKEKGGIYITVTALNTAGVENFSLTPAISANSVTAKGETM